MFKKSLPILTLLTGVVWLRYASDVLCKSSVRMKDCGDFGTVNIDRQDVQDFNFSSCLSCVSMFKKSLKFESGSGKSFHAGRWLKDCARL